MLPQEFLEIRRSEIASDAILGQKQSRSSYMARGVLYPIFGFQRMRAKPDDFDFQERRY